MFKFFFEAQRRETNGKSLKTEKPKPRRAPHVHNKSAKYNKRFEGPIFRQTKGGHFQPVYSGFYLHTDTLVCAHSFTAEAL